MKFHRVNFFEPKPESIRCIAYDEFTNCIAVSRANNSIEIWNVKGNPYQVKIIPGNEDLSIEALTWCKGRLFSCGLSGYILEYDLQALLPTHQLLILSGCPVWCMTVNNNKTKLAVGNEDGYVSLIDVAPSNIVFDKRFDKQEGSILCLAWHKKENVIVTGSADVIRTWDVQTGHVMNRILLSRSNKNTPTIVWCISVLSDLTIVSGDSSGKISFWDGNTGTLISSAGSKKGDILCIAVSNNEEIIYASGVEPTINSFMQSHSNKMWMKSVPRLVHTHDVRALQLVNDLLISGGDDCNLICTKYPPKTVLTFYPFCQKPSASVAEQTSTVLLQYPTAIELWKIGQEIPTHLLRIKPKPSEKIISSSISPDGNLIAYSTEYQMRLFAISQNTDLKNQISLLKIESSSNIPPSNTISFTKDSSRLIICNENKILIVKCDASFIDIEAIIEEDTQLTSNIHLIDLSSNSSYLAVGFDDGNVLIYSLKKLKILCTLPAYKCLATALTFDPSSEHLLVAYSDRKIVEYNISKGAYSDWSKQEMLLNLKENSLYPITSMCYNHDRLFLLEENTIYVIDKFQSFQAHKKLKKSKEIETKFPDNHYNTIKNYEHLSSIHSLEKDIVAVQIPSKVILNALPPPIWKKVYGT